MTAPLGRTPPPPDRPNSGVRTGFGWLLLVLGVLFFASGIISLTRLDEKDLAYRIGAVAGALFVPAVCLVSAYFLLRPRR